MDPRIIKFIKEHHVLTLATSKNNIPWTAHCFYAWLDEDQALVFTSDDDTRHGMEMLENQVVAGGIALETKVLGKIRGIQLTGRISKAQGSRLKAQKGKNEPPSPMSEANAGEGRGGEADARKTYLRRFPYAILMKTTLWILEIETIKFTDNRLGFGKKLYWQRNQTKNNDT